MTDIIHTKPLKQASLSELERAQRLAAIYAKPFATLSAAEKDFLLQEIAVRLGLLAPPTDTA